MRRLPEPVPIEMDTSLHQSTSPELPSSADSLVFHEHAEMARPVSSRLIAIELRGQQFGYAVFEGQKQLLDYGGSHFRPGGRQGVTVARKRLNKLIRFFTPLAIAVKHPERHVLKRHPAIRTIARAIRREAAAHLIAHCAISRNEIRVAFRSFQPSNKYQVAMIVADIFPELNSKLPAKRKLGDPEHPRMVLFDAVSVGLAYWHRNGGPIASQSE